MYHQVQSTIQKGGVNFYSVPIRLLRVYTSLWQSSYYGIHERERNNCKFAASTYHLLLKHTHFIFNIL